VNTIFMNTLLINIVVAAMTVAVFADVLTYHNDNSRTGVNPFDTVLTVKNVNALTFGKKFDLPVDGQVYAQPLVVSNISIGGVLHRVLIVGCDARAASFGSLGSFADPNASVAHYRPCRACYSVTKAVSIPDSAIRDKGATEHDSVYAFDAFSGGPLWQKSILPAGEVPADSISCADLTPENGITSTPVIDPAVHQVFVPGMSRTLTGAHIERLHALDLSTGKDLMSVVISAQFPGTFPAPDMVGGKVQWKAFQERQRSALLLSNGIIYTAFGSFCDQGFYAGWVIAYNEKTFAQVGVFNTNPNSAGKAPGASLSNGSGGGVWGSGSALASNMNHVFATTGNGPFEG
jgi:hypothetical protein